VDAKLLLTHIKHVTLRGLPLLIYYVRYWIEFLTAVILIFSIRATCVTHLILLELIVVIMFNKKYIIKLLVM
jgi:hypothetical protein